LNATATVALAAALLSVVKSPMHHL
jgi:hypothetical protein